MKKLVIISVILAFSITVLFACGEIANIQPISTPINEINPTPIPTPLIGTEGLEYELQDESYAVTGCTGDSSNVIIPNTYNGKNVASINEKAFENNLIITQVTLSNSVTSIGDFAFNGCSALTSITIPDSVTSIGNYAFSGCSKLTIYAQAASKPSSWNYDYSYDRPVYWGINENNFYEADGIQFVIQSGNATLTRFTGSLASITISTTITVNDMVYSVTSIGDLAFSGCSSLTSIIIPDSVTSIRDGAFYGCSSLTIYVQASSKPDGWDSNWNSDNCPVVWEYSILDLLFINYAEQMLTYAHSLNALPEGTVGKYNVVILESNDTAQYAAYYNYDPIIDYTKITRGLFVQAEVYTEGSEFSEENILTAVA